MTGRKGIAHELASIVGTGAVLLQSGDALGTAVIVGARFVSARNAVQANHECCATLER